MQWCCFSAPVPAAAERATANTTCSSSQRRPSSAHPDPPTACGSSAMAHDCACGMDVRIGQSAATATLGGVEIPFSHADGTGVATPNHEGGVQQAPALQDDDTSAFLGDDDGTPAAASALLDLARGEEEQSQDPGMLHGCTDHMASMLAQAHASCDLPRPVKTMNENHAGSWLAVTAEHRFFNSQPFIALAANASLPGSPRTGLGSSSGARPPCSPKKSVSIARRPSQLGGSSTRPEGSPMRPGTGVGSTSPAGKPGSPVAGPRNSNHNVASAALQILIVTQKNSVTWDSRSQTSRSSRWLRLSSRATESDECGTPADPASLVGSGAGPPSNATAQARAALCTAQAQGNPWVQGAGLTQARGPQLLGESRLAKLLQSANRRYSADDPSVAHRGRTAQARYSMDVQPGAAAAATTAA